MKNTIKYMCMIALLALAFTSCKKTETIEKSHRSTFRATIENITDNDMNVDRAYIDFNDPLRHIYFEPNDVVMLFNIDETTPMKSHCATYEAVNNDNGTATFQNCDLGEVAEDKLDAFFAFYPGNIVTNDGVVHYVTTNLSEGENKMKFYVSPTQNYRTLEGEAAIPKNALYMVSKVDNVDHLSDAHFTFKSIFGVFGFKLWDSSGVKTVTEIQIYDSQFNLTGWVEVIISELDPDAKSWRFNDVTNNKGNAVTLIMPEEGVEIGDTKASATQFYMTLRPLALSQGAHLIVTYASGEVKDVYIPAGTLTIAPNTVKRATINLANW